MHTFLVTGSHYDERIAWIHHALFTYGISPFDTRSLDIQEEALSIGIKDVKEFEKQLMLVPIHSKQSAGIIKNAHLLTLDAQNALLKTLEEPPPHTKIYIESEVSSSLLPTILSRCQIIQLTTNPASNAASQSSLPIILQLCDENLSIGKKISLLDEHISNKEEAKVWVTQAIHTLHANRNSLSSTIYQDCMQHLLTASQHLAANVSYKLAIDHIISTFSN